jgi:hypothetical protein
MNYLLKIEYDKELESLIWVISSYVDSEIKYVIANRVIKIDAHNAEILKDGYEVGIE